MGAAPTLVEIKSRIDAWESRSAGEALAETGDFEGALEKLLNGLQLDGEDPVAHNDLGVVLHQLGQLEQAKTSFERALLLAPGMEPARHNLEML